MRVSMADTGSLMVHKMLPTRIVLHAQRGDFSVCPVLALAIHAHRGHSRTTLAQRSVTSVQRAKAHEAVANHTVYHAHQGAWLHKTEAAFVWYARQGATKRIEVV